MLIFLSWFQVGQCFILISELCFSSLHQCYVCINVLKVNIFCKTPASALSFFFIDLGQVLNLVYFPAEKVAPVEESGPF